MKKFFCKTLIIFFILLSQMITFSYCDDIDDDINNETIDVNAEIISASSMEENIKNPDINSRACVVIDRNSGTVLYGKKETEKRKMASTTKIMTAIIIIENYNLNETIEVSKKAAGTGGSRLGLKTGDKITVQDLLYGLMLRSGNDAAVALAEYAGGSIDGFANMMNEKAKSLKLTNTHFETPHGLDSDEHYTTAYELALLSDYALKNKTFSKIVGTKNYTITLNGYPKDLSNTNELLGNFDGVYGIKTGFTNGANRCLVTACKRNNIDIICVVLGADTKKFRTTDSIKLINYTYENFENVNLQELVNTEFENWKKNNIDRFILNKSISPNITLKLEELCNPVIPVKKDLKNNITININCETRLEAPLPENTQIGKIEININNKVMSSCSILTSNNIFKKNILTYFYNFIKEFPFILQNNIL